MSAIAAPPSSGPDWKTWVRTNLAAGCDPVDLQKQMIAAGWSLHGSDQLVIEQARDLFPHLFEDEPEIALPVVPEIGRIVADGRAINVVLSLQRPTVALCTGVLSADECDAIIAYANDRGLSPSTVVDPATGAPVPHPERTSHGLMLKRGETALVSAIERRLGALTHWPVTHGEGLQILRYRNGQEYRPHFDAFPESNAGDVHTRRGGQRVNTVLVYLQTPDEGGATSFPVAGLDLRPSQGDAIVFRNVTRTGKCDQASLHSGVPVISGDKVVMTLWQRAQAFE